jgi:hypothetical protein
VEEQEETAVDMVAAVAVDAVTVEARIIPVPEVHQRKASVQLSVVMSLTMGTKALQIR